jgi:dihydrofolate synthase/folylpolyglutamate synthase
MIVDLENEYKQTIEWLYDLHLFGIKFGLKKIEKLLEFLDNPQDSLRIIHVGGTNGKGSVCAMLSSILTDAGFRVGVNTSPHLSEFTERIQINGEHISKAKVIEYANLLKDIREKVNSETEFGYATYFEVVTAMALQYFADNKVDYVILEVGLGGTFDATNVVMPIISVITNIGLDHTEHLGDTLTSIAENKAGIIKPRIPVLTSNNDQEIVNVISKVCSKCNSQLYQLGKDIQYNLLESATDRTIIKYNGKNFNISKLTIPLIGKHQAENAAVAVGVIDLLSLDNSKKWKISEGNIKNGLENTHWPGRLEIMQKAPLVLLDGAHNQTGAATLNGAIELFKYKNLSMVFGCSEEKNINSILHEILQKANKLYITQADIRRAAKPDQILKVIEKYDIKKIVVPDVKQAVKLAIDKSDPDDMVCVCGSLFVVGEARELWITTKNSNSTDKLPRIHY